MNDQERSDAELSLSSLEGARLEGERRLRQLTIDNRLATEAEIREALELADSLAALDATIEDLRRELTEDSDQNNRASHDSPERP